MNTHQRRCVGKQASLHSVASRLPAWLCEPRVAAKGMFCKSFKWANCKKARRNPGKVLVLSVATALDGAGTLCCALQGRPLTLEGRSGASFPS